MNYARELDTTYEWHRAIECAKVNYIFIIVFYKVVFIIFTNNMYTLFDLILKSASALSSCGVYHKESSFNGMMEERFQQLPAVWASAQG